MLYGTLQQNATQNNKKIQVPIKPTIILISKNIHSKRRIERV